MQTIIGNPVLKNTLSHPTLVKSLSQKLTHFRASDSPTSSSMCVLNVYDVEFRYVAFQCPLPSKCQLFLFDGEMCLIGSDGILYKVSEMALQSKLDGLIEKSLFDVATGYVIFESFDVIFVRF